MSQALVSVLNKRVASEDNTPSSRPKACAETYEQTGERLFLAGEYAAPAEYVEMDTNRRIVLSSPGFLPARLDGRVACYRLVRRGPGETGDLALARRQAQFQRLAAPTHQRLYNFARRALNNPQDAEDVTQETLTRAWTHFEKFDARRSFEAWVFRIAGNLIIDQSRRRRHRQEVPLDAGATVREGGEEAGISEIPDSTADPQECLMAKQISATLQAALRSLPPVHRTTLLLVAQQRSYEQIAHDLDCPLGTVRSRVYRARVRLKRHLKESTFHE